ncbi:MAG: hypothetical protein IJS67_00195, partial [Clostridia bacterium]|nr:hypothetical protein [Clostridia bacterium]
VIRNKSFTGLDEEYYKISKYTDGYLGGDMAKVKRLKKHIEKYKETLLSIYASLRKDVELKGGKLTKSMRQYSQCLYYLNAVRFNENSDLFSEPITQAEDNCVDGSLQTIFNNECYVFGTEGEIDKKFTGKQGNNNFGMQNDCGIACVAQILILSGKRVTENDVVRVAISEGLCNITDTAMGTNGATSPFHRAVLLKKYNINSKVEIADYKKIAHYIERGHGIIVSVDAGLLWNNTTDIGVGHAVVIYGTIHRANDGALIGFVVCDTGSGDMKKYLTCAEFERIYYYNRGINVTSEAIR